MALPHYEMGGPVELGGMATFNMLNGFSESLVRGMRSGFLKDSDYHHMSQCENLEVCCCLPAYLHACLPVCLPVCLSVYLRIFPWSFYFTTHTYPTPHHTTTHRTSS